MASRFPDLGQVHQLLATAIANAYSGATPSTTASAALQYGGMSRIRFFVRVVTASGSSLTSVTVKLACRYNSSDGALTLGWVDLASDKDDAAKTFEVEHVFTVAANQTNDFKFFLDAPKAIPDLHIDVKASAAGIAGDSVTVYATAG